MMEPSRLQDSTGPSSSRPAPARDAAGTGFFDIHCHILPRLDEGSSSLNESEKMLRLARSDGICGIVATPHVVQGVYENTNETIHTAVSELRGISDSVAIYTGAEIRIDRHLAARAAGGELPLINGNSFILVELPAHVIPPVHELEKIITTLRESGITPIFAHPERNIPLLKNIQFMERFVSLGALFQVTAMSITGNRLRKKVFEMIDKECIHAVATDAHDCERRPPLLSWAYDIICRKYGREKAYELFMYNPFRIIHGESIAVK